MGRYETAVQVDGYEIRPTVVPVGEPVKAATGPAQRLIRLRLRTDATNGANRVTADLVITQGKVRRTTMYQLGHFLRQQPLRYPRLGTFLWSSAGRLTRTA